MPSTETELLYRRWIEDLWNGDLDSASEIVAEDFVGHWSDRDIHGRDELTTLIAGAREMLVELKFRIEVGPIIDGDFVAGRWAGQGESPDGPISFLGNDILRVRDGRFVEFWVASSAGG